METFTITVADDGQVTVTAESPGEEMETMQFDNVRDAADALYDLLTDDDSAQAADDRQMRLWDEESERRMDERSKQRIYE